MGYVFGWLLFSFVAGAVGESREIGFIKTFLVSLVLSPLVGLILAFNSDKKKSGPPVSATMLQMIKDGDRFVKNVRYDEGLEMYLRALAYTDKAPEIHFKIARLYSIKRDTQNSLHHLERAVEDGFNNFDKINSDSFLSYLRNQDEFKAFALNGYRMVMAPAQDPGKSTLEQLQQLTDLYDRGALTKEEFEAEKIRILER